MYHYDLGCVKQILNQGPGETIKLIIAPEENN